jgi:hypothetical protein
MIAGLLKCVGHSVVVDYRTNTELICYAKGILKEVIEEESMLVVQSDEKIWYIKISSILTLRVDTT